MYVKLNITCLYRMCNTLAKITYVTMVCRELPFHTTYVPTYV